MLCLVQRKGTIILYRGKTKAAADEICPTTSHNKGSIEDNSVCCNGDDDPGDHIQHLDPKNAITARAGDRVYPFDIIAKQIRMTECFYPKNKDPPFEMPVIYEDDHVAIGE